MKTRMWLAAGCLWMGVQAACAQDAVAPLQENRVDLFPLSDVRITDGQFKTIQELDHYYLLSLDPDRLLSWFRREAGLTPKAQPYPLWESEDFQWTGPLAGHIMGFYLSSMSMMYQTTGDPQILDRLRYVLAELRTVQQTQGDGYLLATRRGRQVFADVVAGRFETSNPVINDTWEPVYIMNKIMLGLYGAYTLCGLEEAKPILIGMADWFGHGVIDKLSHEAMQKLLVCEHGSINESFVDVYRLTGDEKYLRWAERLNDEDMWVPLSEGRDILFGWHANTQIPKFTGFTSVYRYGGDRKMYDAANLFWDIVVKNHTWANGGNSSGEHFFPEAEFESKVPSYGGPESCNSVNMMRLTEALYQTDGRADRLDYYERVLYNHILANFEPEQGMCCYYTSMRPGHYKVHGTRYHSFWCCTGTGLEAPAKFARMVYAHKEDSLYVNMFVPTRMEWREKGLFMEQTTRFPDENRAQLTMSLSAPSSFALKIRKPYWAEEKEFVWKINGRKVKSDREEGGYAVLSRTWKDGDRVEISFVPKLEVRPLKSSTRYYSIQYGPIVLGTKIESDNLTLADFRNATRPVGSVMLPISDVPALFGTAEDICRHITRLPGDTLRFAYTPAEGRKMELIPFHRIHFSRYALYFVRVNDMEEYRRTVAAPDRLADASLLQSLRETDGVRIGDTDSEQLHRMEAVNGSVRKLSREETARVSFNGGYFMYNLRSLPAEKMYLYLDFKAIDQDQFAFDVFVDGCLLKTFTHIQGENDLATTHYSELLPIPADLAAGKKDLTVKIAAHIRHRTADVLDVRLLSAPAGQ